MRMLIAIAFGCALMIGVNHAASSSAAEPAAMPASERSEPAADEAQPEGDTAYECRYSPYCQRDSQCTTYCAGGIPDCVQGCCACAS